MPKKRSLLKKLRNIFITAGIIVLWMCIYFDHILTKLGTITENGFIENKYGDLFFTLVAPPLWEELAWRWFPITLALQLKKHLSLDLLVPICVLASISFGLVHGMGAVSIFGQGIGGLALCYLYIKNGYSYWSTVCAHFLWNLTIALIPG